MIRKNLKKISKSKKLRDILKKYNIPSKYFSTNRQVVSKAVFIGLFIAFIPMPMQMLAVLLVMPFVNFNVPIAIAMCWITNPFTMPFIYYIEYATGSFILNTKVASVEMTLKWFNDNFENIFIPLYIGAFFYSILLSIIAYLFINFLWKFSVHKDKKLHFKDR